MHPLWRSGHGENELHHRRFDEMNDRSVLVRCHPHHAIYTPSMMGVEVEDGPFIVGILPIGVTGRALEDCLSQEESEYKRYKGFHSNLRFRGLPPRILHTTYTPWTIDYTIRVQIDACVFLTRSIKQPKSMIIRIFAHSIRLVSI